MTDQIKTVAGIDLGTSGGRIAVIDCDKKVLFSHSISYPSEAEQTPALWWRTVTTLLKELPENIKENLQSLAVDGTSGTILLCDSQGKPLSSALMYNDLRATKEAKQIKEFMPADNGGQGASGSLARLMWLLKHELQKGQQLQKGQKKGVYFDFAQQDCALSAKKASNQHIHAVHQADYILGMLGGNFCLSDENNCLKLGYDAVKRCWPLEELSKLGIDQSLLPEVFPAGSAVAQITETQAENLGLPKTLKLVTGTTDSLAAFIATGADKVGDAVTSLGSTLVVKLIADVPIFSAEHGVYSHRLSDQWLIGGASNSGAKVLRHFFSQDKIDTMTTQLSPHKSTGLDYYPLITVGERFPIADATKAPQLLPRPESGLEFFQGMLEGIAHIEAQGYQKLVELGAPAISSVRSVGGGSKNKAWTTIRKNRLNVKMLTPKQSDAAYGSALLALKGIL